MDASAKLRQLTSVWKLRGRHASWWTVLACHLICESDKARHVRVHSVCKDAVRAASNNLCSSAWSECSATNFARLKSWKVFLAKRCTSHSTVMMILFFRICDSFLRLSKFGVHVDNRHDMGMNV
jgi:hypothetical protein